MFIERVLNVLWCRLLISDDGSGSGGFLYLDSFFVAFHVGTKSFKGNERGLEAFKSVKMTSNESKEADWEESAAVFLFVLVFLFVIFLVFLTVVFLIFLIFLSVFVVFFVFLVVFILFNGISFESNSVV
jgi:hypothetical protein